MTRPSPEERADAVVAAARRTAERVAPLAQAYALPTDTPPAFAALLARLAERTRETT